MEDFEGICLTDGCFDFVSEKTYDVAYGSKRRTMSWPCGDQDIELLRRRELCDARVHLRSGAWRQLWDIDTG